MTASLSLKRLVPDRARRALAEYRSYYRSARQLWSGMRAFQRTGVTPEIAYHELVLLYCRTQGRSNDLLHALVSLLRPPVQLPPAVGLLGDFRKANSLGAVVNRLREDGYYIFPQQLPRELIDRLIDYARREPALPCPPDGKNEPLSARVYDPKNPASVRYDFTEAQLVTNADVQALMADPSVLAVAQSYLQCRPLLDMVAMWWTIAGQKAPSSNAAQLFHFDMDRIKWLKFFVYLTDVTFENGPTTVVRGSHRKRPPRELLSHGYQRLSDEQMLRHYRKEDLVEVTVPRGTVVAMDTRAFHKGKPVTRGERLALQLEFCDSLFGAHYHRSSIKPASGTALSQMIANYPSIYAKFQRGT